MDGAFGIAGVPCDFSRLPGDGHRDGPSRRREGPADRFTPGGPRERRWSIGFRMIPGPSCPDRRGHHPAAAATCRIL